MNITIFAKKILRPLAHYSTIENVTEKGVHELLSAGEEAIGLYNDDD